MRFLSSLVCAAAASIPIEAIAQDWTTAHQSMRDSLVYLEAEGFDASGNLVISSATGVIIDSRGLVLTVEHFLDGMVDAVDGSVTLTARTGSKYGTPVDLLQIDFEIGLDLQIFSLPDTGVTYRAACLYSGSSIAVRTEIGTSGFPETTDYYSTTGRIENLSGHPDSPIAWQTDLDLNHGQSGSPVYTSDGEVVAIAQAVASGADGLAYVMPLSRVLATVSGFADCGASADNDPPVLELTEEQQSCIQLEYESRLTVSFSQGGSARCPGGGCLFRSSDCNERSALLSYAAPVGYRIESYSYQQLASNDASNGPVQDERDEQGITSLSILLRCQPSSQPGAGGGWSEGQFSGVARYASPRDLMTQVREFCGATPM